MEKLKNNLLEDSEGVALLVGYMIGVDILSIGNSLTNIAKQDAWIAVAIGGIYPLGLSFLSWYYVKKHPSEDILTLSKKYLGKVLGTICNILFMAQFAIYFLGSSSGLVNVYIVNATPFLTPVKLYIPVIFLCVYLNQKGIKVLARINKIAFYSTIILEFTVASALLQGNYLNLFPILGSGYKSVFHGVIESAFAYGGIEGIFLIYPFLINKNKIKAITLKATFFIIGIHIWITSICIYFLGYKVTSIALWPVLLLTESVSSPVFSNFRFIFLFLWSIVVFKVVANQYYAINYILSDTLKVKHENMLSWLIAPIIFYLCLKMGSEVQRRAFLGYIIPKVTFFNIAYITIIAILIFIKDKRGD